MVRKAGFYLPLLLSPLAGQSAEDLSKELDALLNTPVTVASKKSTSARETPGIVSVVTREDIRHSGARDLIDVLRMVPGFEFGVDVQGVTGISVRGLWAHEGKVLLLWDGLEMNETLFGNIAVGQHFPVDQIERVEVIRGPGSSLYGGYAEVAVVQVTSVKVMGVGAGWMQGSGKGGALRSQGHLVAGGMQNGFAWNLGVFGGQGQRSGGTYIDGTGTSADLTDRNRIRPMLINLSLEGAGLQFRFLSDRYELDTLANFGGLLQRPVPVRFGSTHADLRGTFSPGKAWTLQPYLTWKTQQPWWSSDPDAGAVQLTTADRLRAGVTVNYEPDGPWSYSAGVETIRDEAKMDAGSNTPPAFLNGTMRTDYRTTATFFQAQYRGLVNITAGARYESSSATESSFVPRLAFTKAWGDWHAKLLLAKAFRSPAILNLNLPLDPAQPLEPEKTTSSELEVGRRLGNGLLTLSVFDLKIEKPIVFTVTDTSLGYFNQSQTRSRGWELEYRARFMSTSMAASWSHHTADNAVEAWMVPGHPEAFLGAPRDKFVLTGTRHFGPWSLNVSGTHLGSRWAYASNGGREGMELKEMTADFLIQANVSWEQGPWFVALGVQDLQDRAPGFIQPYNGGHGPLPGPGREAVLKVRWGF